MSSMFVFPANDEGYRKRKRAHKACEQCKRRRKRCDFPMGSVRCVPCEKADILCSLAPDFQLQEKVPRLDDLATQNVTTGRGVVIDNAAIAAAAAAAANRPVARPVVVRSNSNQFVNNSGSTNVVESSSNGANGHNNNNHVTQSHATQQLTRPGISRTSSFNPQHLRGSTPPVTNNTKHKRTSSHSPSTASNDTIKAPSPSLFQRPLLASTTTQRAQHEHEPSVDRESIGVWVRGITTQNQRLNPHLYTYLSSINAFSMPLRPNREALIKLYCDSIDAIFPLLDTEQFIKLHAIGQAPTLLLHAVLLAAARHPDAAQHLGHQTVRQFCTSTATKIRALLFAEVEQDRLTLVRVYALLSFDAEGPDGLENSCADIQKAIHYAQSLGLHHDRDFVDKKELLRVWWSLWCMDRLNACANARPLIVNLDDVGVKIVTPAEHPRLAQMIQICYTLEQVIYLYRPIRAGEQTKRIPPQANQLFVGDDTLDPHRAIYALMHHTAVILAHKRSAPSENNKTHTSTNGGNMWTPMTVVLAEKDAVENNAPSPERSPGAKNREAQATDARLLSSAGAILRILKNSTGLAPIPLIPYCASLTMTVFLRTFPRHDSETGFSWTDACSMLDKMSSRWWVAGAMGTMGWNLFKSLEEQRSKENVPPLQPTRSTATASSSSTTPSTHPPNPNAPPVSLSMSSGFETVPEEPIDSMDSMLFTEPAVAAIKKEPMDFDITVNMELMNNGLSYSSPEDQVPMEEQFLNMFSDLPNQTSFLDQALSMDPTQFANVEQWFQEKR